MSMDLETATAHIKGNFLHLCKQYNGMGIMLAKIGETHRADIKDPARIAELSKMVLDQFHHMGGQMRVLGDYIDQLPGPSVMKADPQLPDNVHLIKIDEKKVDRNGNAGR